MKRLATLLPAAALAGSTLPAVPAAAEPAASAAVRYEAEDAVVHQRVVESNHTGFTGSGFVNYANTAGSHVGFTVESDRAGSTALGLRFANGTSADRPLDITVDYQRTHDARHLAYIKSRKISVGGDGRTNLTDISIGTNVGNYSHYIERDRKTNDFHGLGAFLIMNEQLRAR